MTQFRLEKKEATKALVKFHIVNSACELCGSVSVPPSQEAALLASWKGAQEPPRKPAGRAALAAALRKAPRLNKEAILRGC